MDYIEEQKQEIEALEAIFADELAIFDRESVPRLQLPIKEELSGASARLEFLLLPKYPEELPKVTVQTIQGISTTKKIELHDFLLKESQNNIGTPMIFSLHSCANEWMAENLVQGGGDDEDDSLSKKQEDTMFETRDEEEEQKIAHRENMKFHGTPVTKESFNEWREHYDADMAESRRLQTEKGDPRLERLTGRQLFEMNKATVDEDSESFWEEEAEEFDMRAEDEQEVEVNADAFAFGDGSDVDEGDSGDRNHRLRRDDQV